MQINVGTIPGQVAEAVVEVDANGNPTSNAAISIPFSQIQANSNYGYIVDFYTNIG